MLVVCLVMYLYMLQGLEVTGSRLTFQWICLHSLVCLKWLQKQMLRVTCHWHQGFLFCFVFNLFTREI